MESSTSLMKERFGKKTASEGAEKTATSTTTRSMTSIDGAVKQFVSSWTPAGVAYEDIVWFNVFFLLFVHIGAVYGLVLGLLVPSGGWLLALALGILWPLSGFGITAGVHRLWSHKAYKAHWSVRVVFAILNSLAYQGSIFEWARDHRVHHMRSETDGDPYNYSRGAFFAHMGWIMVRKHPEVIATGKKINCEDLKADPIVMIQKKLYLPSVFLFCYILPTVLGWAVTGHVWASFWILGVFRHIFVLQCTWLVNSLAHAMEHGDRPYASINAAENWVVSLAAVGEGWHNFHHAFPKDVHAAEGFWWQYNPSSTIIDALALVGLVWDRHFTSPSLIAKHKERTAKRRAAGISVLAPHLQTEDEIQPI